jgi:hypothetical protein
LGTKLCQLVASKCTVASSHAVAPVNDLMLPFVMRWCCRFQTVPARPLGFNLHLLPSLSRSLPVRRQSSLYAGDEGRRVGNH